MRRGFWSWVDALLGGASRRRSNVVAVALVAMAALAALMLGVRP